MNYELSQLRQGWKETSTREEDIAVQEIQVFTGWSLEQSAEAFSLAQWTLAEAEQRMIEESAQAFYDKHGYYPSKPFFPRCKIAIGGYSVSRAQVKTRHCSESSRIRYTWMAE